MGNKYMETYPDLPVKGSINTLGINIANVYRVVTRV
jgi:hypothetical protein